MSGYDVTVYLRRTGRGQFALFTKNGNRLIEYNSVAQHEAENLARAYISSWTSWTMEVEIAVTGREKESDRPVGAV